jgi:hypothetical protein
VVADVIQVVEWEWTMSDQLPAIIPPGALTTSTDTYIVPSLIAAAGDAAGWRFVEFFTPNIAPAIAFSAGVNSMTSRSRPSGRFTWRPG